METKAAPRTRRDPSAALGRPPHGETFGTARSRSEFPNWNEWFRYKSSDWERQISSLPSVVSVTIGKAHDYNEKELSELENDMLDLETNSGTSVRENRKEFEEICLTNGTWKIILRISNNDDQMVEGLIVKVISIINGDSSADLFPPIVNEFDKTEGYTVLLFVRSTDTKSLRT